MLAFAGIYFMAYTAAPSGAMGLVTLSCVVAALAFFAPSHRGKFSAIWCAATMALYAYQLGRGLQDDATKLLYASAMTFVVIMAAVWVFSGRSKNTSS